MQKKQETVKKIVMTLIVNIAVKIIIETMMAIVVERTVAVITIITDVKMATTPCRNVQRIK